MRYASVEQLVEFLGPAEPVPEDAEQLLDQASEDIDSALYAAVYSVDAEGLPLDPEGAAAIVRATCAQAVYLDEIGDRTGAGRQWQSASLGGAAYTRASSARGAGSGATGPRALRILQNAGLLTARVTTPWR